MMAKHAGGILLHTAADAAATVKDGTLTATFVNPSYGQPRTVSLSAAGEMELAQLYTCDRVAPFTHFDAKPVVPVRSGDDWTVEMPPHSMLIMQLRTETEG